VAGVRSICKAGEFGKAAEGTAQEDNTYPVEDSVVGGRSGPEAKMADSLPWVVAATSREDDETMGDQDEEDIWNDGGGFQEGVEAVSPRGWAAEEAVTNGVGNETVDEELGNRGGVRFRLQEGYYNDATVPDTPESEAGPAKEGLGPRRSASPGGSSRHGRREAALGRHTFVGENEAGWQSSVEVSLDSQAETESRIGGVVPTRQQQAENFKGGNRH
jgi:hypothetical protein